MQRNIRNAGLSVSNRRSRRTHAHSLLWLAIAGSLLAGPGVAVAQSAGEIGDPDSWRSDEFHRDWGLAAINAHHAYARGLTGAGISLGQYDSGVALNHPEFQGQGHIALHLSEPGCAGSGATLVFRGPGNCFSARGDNPTREINFVYPYNRPSYSYAGYGTHGTHVAGTMVAKRDGNGMHGVAYQSRLVTARFFGDTIYHWTQNANGTWQRNYLAGTGIGNDPEVIRTMYDQMGANGVRAVNIEIWLPIPATPPHANTVASVEATYRSEQASYDAYIDGALRHGIVNVVALGNDSGRIANIYPGMAQFRPEAQSHWLSVANVQRAANGTGYEIAPSSSICSYTKEWCVSAPGTQINSSTIGGRFDYQTVGDIYGGGPLEIRVGAERPELGYGDLTGTSMAAPHAIGALSLLFERFPYLSGPQVRDVMLTTATDLGAPGVDDLYGWGLIDLKKAIDGPGQIRVDTDVVMDRAAGGAKVWDGPAWDDWRNDIGGPGVLTKSGIGWLRLSGSNAFGGLNVRDGVLELTGQNAYAAQVEGGTLLVNGTLQTAALPVRVGGALAGSGRIVGDVRVEGAVVPGNSIGTLTVQGNYTQAAGSSFVAELAADGRADHLTVEGRATLEGGQVVVVQAPGQYLLGQSFDLLHASGGVSGQFAGVDQTGLSPFLKFGLSYAADQVAVDVTRGASLASAARTDNQRAVATAADRLAIGQGLPQPLTQLFPEPAQAAFDALSGESHASLRSVMVDDSRHLRDAALARSRAGRGGFAAYSDGDGDGDGEGEGAHGAWAQGVKSGGTLDGDGNAARNEYDGSATWVGYDYRFASGWRLGALGGTGRSDSHGARLDKGRIKSRHLGVYAGWRWGGFGLDAGLAVARHDVVLDRSVAFNGFSDRTHAAYDADSRQGFVEGAYRIRRGAWTFEPYAQFAQVRVKSDAFQESGGAAALTGRSAESRVNLSTLGLRFDVGLKGSQQNEEWLSLRGGLGRRHASGDRTPETAVAWRGGEAFAVRGTPLADNATVLDIGIAARLSADSLLELGYSGQYGDEARDHGLNARYSFRF